jgi:hypothetical protein
LAIGADTQEAMDMDGKSRHLAKSLGLANCGRWENGKIHAQAEHSTHLRPIEVVHAYRLRCP